MNDTNDSNKLAARAEIARVATFWGSGDSYVPIGYEIKTLNGKAVEQSKLTTCDLLTELHSGNWMDRALSANLLTTHREKGVLDALIQAMSDDNLNVVASALRAFYAMTNQYPAQEQEASSIPDPESIREWWAKKGATIKATLKLTPGPECGK